MKESYIDKKKLKADIILVSVLIVLCIVAYLIIQFVVKKDGTVVVVKVDGKEKYELSLDVDTILEIEGYSGGYNQLVIKDGAVYMTEADCPDDICVLTGKISKTGETIVCLPHRVVIEIKGTATDSYDSVVR